MRQTDASPQRTRVAVVSAAGTQYLVRVGDTLVLPTPVTEKTLSFVDLLSGRRVRATVLRVGRGKKIAVRKFKPKVRYLRRRGHRQPESLIQIESIEER